MFRRSSKQSEGMPEGEAAICTVHSGSSQLHNHYILAESTPS
jgi:hypothetical protein